MKLFWNRLLQASLWLASIGLMIASSGLDGAYLAKLMPTGFAWLGLLLNTMTDLTSELGMYWYGRLQMDRSSTKQKRARWLLVGQIVLVGYAWLFSWRQLVPIIAKVDPGAWWMAPIGAAFIPSALIVVGYTQALLAGRVEDVKATAKVAPVDAKLASEAPTEPPTVTAEPPMTPTIDKPVPSLDTEARRERVLAAMLADEPPTQAELADRLAVSRSTIGNDVARLRQAGRLNGQGGTHQ